MPLGVNFQSTPTQNRALCARVLFDGLDSRVNFSPKAARSERRVLTSAEYVYGTTIQHNYNVGWGVMTLSSYDVFQQSRQLPGYQTSMLGQILTNETDPLFSWQYNEVCFSASVTKNRAN